MKSRISLRGITWNHARGYAPMLATAARFQESHPDVEITWEKHPLKVFEESPVERLAADFDLLVLDHPCVRQAAPTGVLLPLDECLAPAFLADQAAQTVGASHATYQYAGRQWALAIDAATPVAFWRSDLLARQGFSVPRSWEEVVALARRGHVEVPAAPINCLMNFYALCVAAGEIPCAGRTQVVSPATGLAALAQLRELLALCDPHAWSRNPIASHELVAAAGNETIFYCPLAYGYSNYARAGFAAHALDFGETPRFQGQTLRTTLGGAGLALSALRPLRREAVAYAEFVASPLIQRAIYTHSGGQPGHRSAWLDAENNRLTRNYFQHTLPVLDRAYVRPHFSGYQHFQTGAGPIVHAALRATLAPAEALTRLDALYRTSLEPPVLGL